MAAGDYSGYGGQDSPSERSGVGRGSAGGNSSSGSSKSGGSSSSRGGYSGYGGQDSPSERSGVGRGSSTSSSSGARDGGNSGGYGGSGRAGGVGSPGVGGGFSSSGSREGGGSAANGRGDVSAAGRAGGVGSPGVGGGFYGAVGVSSIGGRATSSISPMRPDNRSYAGPVGMGGPGGMYVGGAPNSIPGAYRDMAANMRAAGVIGLDGRPIDPPSPMRPDNLNYAGPVGMGGVGGLYVGAPPSAASPQRPDNFAAGMADLGRGISASAPATAQRTEMDDIVDRIIGVESANNPNAKNPLSSAIGLGQFIGSTWMSMMEKYRPDLTAGKTRAEILGLRTDPVLAREMTKAYAVENASILEQHGIRATPAAVYAAHFLGPQGAVKAYQSDKSTPAVDVFGRAVVNANPSIMRGKTVGDVLGYVDRNMSTGAAWGAQSFAPTPPSDRAPVPASRPETFEGKYLGSSPVAPSRPGTTIAPTRPDTTLAPTLPGGRAPSAPAPGAATPAQPPTSTAPRPNPSVTAPAVPPAVPGRPPASAPPAPPAPPEEEKKGLSKGQKIAAGAVDIGIGLIPGVGVAASIYNGVAALTGNPTVGEVAIDILGNGNVERGYFRGPVDPDRDSSTSFGGQLISDGRPTSTEKVFVDKYLSSFVDPTPRPTPREKFAQNRETYGRTIPA
jgi:hypothetical protein